MHGYMKNTGAKKMPFDIIPSPNERGKETRLLSEPQEIEKNEFACNTDLSPIKPYTLEELMTQM